MHKPLHPKSDVNRLYLPTNKEGRGLKSAQNGTELAVLSLDKYVRNNHEKSITNARETNNEDLDTEQKFKQRKYFDRRKMTRISTTWLVTKTNKECSLKTWQCLNM